MESPHWDFNYWPLNRGGHVTGGCFIGVWLYVWIQKQTKEIAANIQPSWPHGWSITNQYKPLRTYYSTSLHVLLQYGHSPITEESQLNGCYVSHIIIHSGTHVVKVPDHVKDKIASPVNCALATMVNVTSGLVGKNPHRNTVAVIQVHLATVSCSYKSHCT